MRLDVFFGGSSSTPADVAGPRRRGHRRAARSTTIAVALANGARAVIPFESSEEVDHAREGSSSARDVLLAGERKMLAIPGFDLGNSPREFTREAVEGKTVLSRRPTARRRCSRSRARVTSWSPRTSTSRRCMRHAAAAARGGTDMTHRLRRARPAVRARGRGLRGPLRRAHREAPSET